jgi:hypothetical protein
VGRTRLAAANTLKANWNESGEDVYGISYRANATNGNAVKARGNPRYPLASVVEDFDPAGAVGIEAYRLSTIIEKV